MRRYLVFSVVGLALFMASVAGTTVSVAFPTIISELNASLVLSGWVLSVYQLVAIGTMPLIAKMSDISTHQWARPGPLDQAARSGSQTALAPG